MRPPSVNRAELVGVAAMVVGGVEFAAAHVGALPSSALFVPDDFHGAVLVLGLVGGFVAGVTTTDGLDTGFSTTPYNAFVGAVNGLRTTFSGTCLLCATFVAWLLTVGPAVPVDQTLEPIRIVALGGWLFVRYVPLIVIAGPVLGFTGGVTRVAGAWVAGESRHAIAATRNRYP